MTDKISIPAHPFPSSKLPFAIEKLSHNNHYDYHKKHRHKYFELILIEQGGGKQWIDFLQVDLKDCSCYLIAPQQIHLLERTEKTLGTVIQFGEEMIKDSSLLSQLKIVGQPILFEVHVEKFRTMQQFVALAETTLLPHQTAYRGKVEGFLQHLCFHLLTSNSKALPPIDSLYLSFVQLVEQQFKDWHTVAEYTKMLGITESKLGKVVRAYRDQTPLQFIHKRLLLEAKRLLLFENLSVKEVAYTLGFSYPSNFTAFVKNKTGVSPSALKKEIHK